MFSDGQMAVLATELRKCNIIQLRFYVFNSTNPYAFEQIDVTVAQSDNRRIKDSAIRKLAKPTTPASVPNDAYAYQVIGSAVQPNGEEGLHQVTAGPMIYPGGVFVSDDEVQTRLGNTEKVEQDSVVLSIDEYDIVGPVIDMTRTDFIDSPITDAGSQAGMTLEGNVDIRR